MVALELKPAHSAVVGVLIASNFVLQWMGFQVGGARRRFGIKYPKLYAESSDSNADAFNCYQRGHQNTLETWPTYLTLQVLSAYEYPLISTGAGVVFLLGRISYFRGYATGDPKNRAKGNFGYLGIFTMLGLSIKFAYTLATSG
ncbi:microsomal glutathione S-transferase [Hyaloraphidium curvatum]|nr:microsomal glutathione S-transferase [Hyaloraphidium curvatum]